MICKCRGKNKCTHCRLRDKLEKRSKTSASILKSTNPSPPPASVATKPKPRKRRKRKKKRKGHKKQPSPLIDHIHLRSLEPKVELPPPDIQPEQLPILERGNDPGLSQSESDHDHANEDLVSNQTRPPDPIREKSGIEACPLPSSDRSSNEAPMPGLSPSDSEPCLLDPNEHNQAMEETQELVLDETHKEESNKEDFGAEGVPTRSTIVLEDANDDSDTRIMYKIISIYCCKRIELSI